MRYFPPRHNLTSRITASLLIILYILTLGPLKEALAFVIPQNLLPIPILSSQITKFSSISGKYDQVCRYNPTTKKFEYFVVGNPEYSKFTTLEAAKGYQVNFSSECILRITGRLSNTKYSSSLLTGWQMLGYYSKNRVKVSDALANLIKGTNYDRISKYDKAANTFVDLAPADYLEPGVSYFIRVLKNSTWTVLPKTNLAEFAYNADGSRVKKIVNGTATVYIDGLYEKTGSAITKHIFAGASRVCSVNTQTSSPANPQTYYYHPDHLGSSNVITNASGAQLQLAEYKPYGSLSRNEPANPLTSSPVNYLFTGKELDSTGLYYYGARYYDPKIGRFITPDPITQNLYDPQNLNAYTYCRNNPLRYIDPTGEYSLQAFGDSLNTMYSNSRNFWLGDNPKGFASGVFNSLVAASSVTLVVAMLPATFLASPFMGALGWAAGVAGGASLGAATGMAITGKDLAGRPLTEYQRGELFGASTVGLGLLGVGAWGQYRRLGSILGIKDPTSYKGQGGAIALGRFSDLKGLKDFANNRNARILDQPVPKGYTLEQYLRGEIDSADKIYLRMKDVKPGYTSYDVELSYIKSKPELRYNTELIYDE